MNNTESLSSSSSPTSPESSSPVALVSEVSVSQLEEELVYEYAMRVIFFHVHTEISMPSALEKLRSAFNFVVEKHKSMEDRVIFWNHEVNEIYIENFNEIFDFLD